jgi:multiple sugar transport system substrate-binding protein
MKPKSVFRIMILMFLLGSFAMMFSTVVAQEDAELSGNITLLIVPAIYSATGGDSAEGVVNQFREATGVEVEVVTAETAQIIQRATVEFIAGTGTFDVIVWNSQWTNAENAQFLEPLDDYIAAAGDDFDIDDIFVSLREPATFDGNLYQMPVRVGTAMLYYRVDLFEEAGLEPPQTWEEYRTAAEILTQDINGDGEIDVYGAVQRGEFGNSVQQDFIRFLFAHGGQVLSPDFSECTLNNEEGVEAAENFVWAFINGYAPPDMLAYGRDDYIVAMQQGRAAMSVQFSPYWDQLVDPEASPQAENMGWALVPASPGVELGTTQLSGWYFVIDRNSSNKQAAWALIQAMSNKENQLRMALDYGNGPIRESVYENEEYQERFPVAQGWLDATANSVFEPAHERYQEMIDIISEEITAAFQQQKSPQEAMDSACARIEPLL